MKSVFNIVDIRMHIQTVTDDIEEIVFNKIYLIVAEVIPSFPILSGPSE